MLWWVKCNELVAIFATSIKTAEKNKSAKRGKQPTA